MLRLLDPLRLSGSALAPSAFFVLVSLLGEWHLASISFPSLLALGVALWLLTYWLMFTHERSSSAKQVTSAQLVNSLKAGDREMKFAVALAILAALVSVALSLL